MAAPQRTMTIAVVAAVTLGWLLRMCAAAVVVDVFRLVQYDLQGKAMGSRKTYVNHYASAGMGAGGGDAGRVVMILAVQGLDLPGLQEYVQKQRDLGGLLLLLPDKVGEVRSEMEAWLVGSQLGFPVYFCREDERMRAILGKVAAGEAAGRPATATLGGFKLLVPVAEAKKLPSAALVTIQGWLAGQGALGQEGRTIAVVAHYDTFGALPALAAGSDGNGSGVAALLELARLYSRLYSSGKTRGGYNLLFVLTSGGPYNFDGTAKWLAGLDQRIKESIDFALCLDTLGSPGQELLWHVSKPLNNADMQQMYEDVASVAVEEGGEVQVKHKKINISSSRVAWAHEQFSRHRIMAATLSTRMHGAELLQGSRGMFDERDGVDDAVLVRNIRIVAEGLARHIYGRKGDGMEVFAHGSSLAINPAYVRSWLDFLSRTPRVAPYLPRNSSVVAALSKELSEHIPDVTQTTDVLDDSFVFYDSVKAELSIQEVAGVTFDIVVMLLVAAYLGLIFILLLGTTKGLDDIFEVLRKPTSKKLKPL